MLMFTPTAYTGVVGAYILRMSSEEKFETLTGNELEKFN